MSKRKPYRLLEHTADVRVRVSGRTKKRLFQNAVFALTDLLADAVSVRARGFKTIRVSAASEDVLLVRLLQEVLFLFDAKGFLAGRLEFMFWKGKGKGSESRLEARLWGEPFDPERHRPKSEIKAATLHGLAIRKRGGYLAADLTFDV